MTWFVLAHIPFFVAAGSKKLTEFHERRQFNDLTFELATMAGEGHQAARTRAGLAHALWLGRRPKALSMCKKHTTVYFSCYRLLYCKKEQIRFIYYPCKPIQMHHIATNTDRLQVDQEKGWPSAHWLLQFSFVLVYRGVVHVKPDDSLPHHPSNPW